MKDESSFLIAHDPLRSLRLCVRIFLLGKLTHIVAYAINYSTIC